MLDSTPPSHRCPICKSTSVNARNLAVFIDGTSNKPGDKETNVMKLYNLVSNVEGSEVKQHTYYLEGIGVYDDDNLSLLGRTGMRIYSGVEMALAWNVNKNVMEAYGWLARNYRKGAQIYLFGFSRGAYQVRALAAMVHEVGLVKEPRQKRIHQAYRRYLSINPNNPQTREAGIQFKKAFCWPDVRIHFVGVWDTVSSLGLIKRDVHITASGSVTNACHFRHALALDERRVKFMPEYFLEVNAQRSRPAVSDVKEVWFAGCHSDVGGISRPRTELVPNLVGDKQNPAHAGNVPLLWMTREAAKEGLVFKSEEVVWCPEDIDLGRDDTMKSFWWKFLEFLPIRHQVSFSGTGKHSRRSHRSRPRLIIPCQQIHSSVLSGDAYTPHATLGECIDVPTVPRRASDGLWTTDLPDEGGTTRLLTSLLSDRRRTLENLPRVLFLLDSRLGDRQTQAIPNTEWLGISIREQSGFNKFALTVIYDVISNFSILQELARDARAHLRVILRSPNHLHFLKSLYILRFSARHRTLRQHFIAHDDVINALMLALERINESCSDNLFPLIMDSLRYLVCDSDHRTIVVDQLSARLDGTEAGKTRLSLALEVKAPSHLIASLKMIASLAQHQPGHCEGLKPRIIDLAREARSPVGSVAVDVLVALNVPLTPDICISNILGYLGNILPRLDAEVGSMSSPDVTVALPPVFQVNGAGELDNEDMVMRELLRTIESRHAHQRTAATLTLLKLCSNQIIRVFCSRNKVLDIFMKQLERKETSLLAAYAFKTCLRHNMWMAHDLVRVDAARLILTMLDKGWFDGVVGRVEGSKIFRELMTFCDLRHQVIHYGIVATLRKKLEIGDCHETRMSLICLDILEEYNQVDMPRMVTDSLALLRDRNIKVQKRGVKTLCSLAQTKAGEQAIKLHVTEVVKMLLPSDGSSPPRSQLFGPSAVLHNLCRSETLREAIKKSDEYAGFRDRRDDGTLYPQTR